MKKRNIEEITRNLNIARIQAKDREFKNNTELQIYLEQFGIKTKGGYIYKYKKFLNNGKFQKAPIYIDRVKAIYDSSSNKEENINNAIALLKKYGYKVLAPVTEYKEI